MPDTHAPRLQAAAREGRQGSVRPVPARLAPTRPTLALVTLCAAVLIARLDTSVANLAVDPIGRSFRADLATLQWVIDAYNLAYAVLLLTGGLLADLRGRRHVFMAGCAIFTFASLLCALAPGIALLIAARALAGLGAALMLPASLALIRVVWPDPAARGRALGIWAACNGLAFVIGPPLGGVLIGWSGWRGIFLLVVPFGLAALALAARTLPDSADPADRHFDAAGQALGMAALGGLVVAAIEARRAAPAALGALAIAGAALVLFLVVEARRGPAALVPLRMFRVGAFRGAVVATLAMTFGMYGVLFLLPLTWQSTGRLDAVDAGLALVPMALVFALVSPFSGSLTQRVGARAMTSGGVAVIGGGLLVLGLTAFWRSVPAAEIGLILTGLGMGIATGPLLGVAVAAVPAARSGTAAALVNLARMVGATLGVAILGSVFAAAEGGAAGLRLAMLLGGLVQLSGAAVAWREARPVERVVR